METYLVHAIFVVLFVIGIYLIAHKDPSRKPNKNEIALTRMFLWGFILINGFRWSIFCLPAGFLASLGG